MMFSGTPSSLESAGGGAVTALALTPLRERTVGPRRTALHAARRAVAQLGPLLRGSGDPVRSAARGCSCGQVMLSDATAELVADHLPDGADLVDLGCIACAISAAERVLALSRDPQPS